MKIDELEKMIDIPSFDDMVDDKSHLRTLPRLSVLQINVGRLCNLECKHCHVSAGPMRKEIMSKEVLESCLKVFKKHGFDTIDITGGAPEMNPNFEWFLKECSKLADRVIVRSNLVILLSDKYKHLIDVYKENKVNIVCSIPFYTKRNTDNQRGDGVFEKSIEVLRLLNGVGYGIDPELSLDIVYNPNGAFLPPSQDSMQSLYKEKLYSQFGVVFNNLYTITNNPIGRFGDFLHENGLLDEYMSVLFGSFNQKTVENMMCRNQISVSWDGSLYDCDFNQAVDMKIEGSISIFDLENGELNTRRIVTGKHCYGCTAGAGSSCGGATSE